MPGPAIEDQESLERGLPLGFRGAQAAQGEQGDLGPVAKRLRRQPVPELVHQDREEARTG